jgi:serine/threonine protein kinase
MCYYRFGDKVDPASFPVLECLPPENISDAKPWSHDVWSLGMVIFELATGLPVNSSKKCKVLYTNGKSIIN